jgi:hypothetical protein
VIGSIAQKVLSKERLRRLSTRGSIWAMELLWESRAFHKQQEILEKQHSNRYVVIGGSRFLGSSQDYEEASKLGYTQRGLKSFMVHYMSTDQIRPAPRITVLAV